MDCNTYRVLITGYIDGELSEEEVQVLKAHLHICKPCVAYLTRAEAMKIVLKRSRLLQDIPEVPVNFARNIGIILENTAQPVHPALWRRLAQSYRTFVFGLAEKWMNSLRMRPYTWITSLSCVLVLLAGVVFVDIFQTVLKQPPASQSSKLMVQLQPSPIPRDISVKREEVQKPPAKKMHAVEPESDTLATRGLVAERKVESVELAKDKGTPVVAKALPMAPQPAESQTAEGQLLVRASETSPESLIVAADAEMPLEFIEVTDETLPQSVQNTSVDNNYVYSHVLEVAQEQVLDDTMFVGYIQDVLR